MTDFKLKQFAKNATNTGQFGSYDNGTPTTTSDPAVIQDLPAWENGWLDATSGATKLPRLEEMQGVQSVLCQALINNRAYGILPYRADVEYSLNGIVQDDNGNQFSSLKNNNIGNPLTDTSSWKLKDTLSETVKFSINEASKDTSGNPNYMSIIGDQISFNGSVKYTQSDGVFKEYASISPIDLISGYVMINNGVAEVVPALEVKQSEPVGIVLRQPIFTSNTTDNFTIISNLTNEDLYTLYNGVSSSYEISSWADCILGLSYTSALKLSSYTLQADSNINPEHPIEWYVEGSNDGVNWVEVDYRNNEDFTLGELRVFEVSSNEEYKSFRIRFIRGIENDSKGELKKIGFEFLNLKNQSVWFNPYTNEAKQFNGTDWVEYNGVPVGKVYNGQAINFYHNTYANLLPELFISGAGNQLIDSYVNDESFYDIYAKNVNGEVKYYCEQGGVAPPGSTKTTVNLIIPYIETVYNVLATNIWGSTSGIPTVGTSNYEVASFDIFKSSTVVFTKWKTEGYCNKPEEIL